MKSQVKVWGRCARFLETEHNCYLGGLGKVGHWAGGQVQTVRKFQWNEEGSCSEWLRTQGVKMDNAQSLGWPGIMGMEVLYHFFTYHKNTSITVDKEIGKSLSCSFPLAVNLNPY